MYKREREFNIITGEISTLSFGRRSLSCASQFKNLNKTEFLKSRIPRLGDPKDKKLFQYGYIDRKDQRQFPLIKQSQYYQQKNEHTNKSMLNYVSTDYNIISHRKQIETSKIVDSLSTFQKHKSFFKKSPLTEHIHSARKNAPNYHEDFSYRVQKNQFKRKSQLCSSICDIQKSYGPTRYFRKYK